MNKNSAILLLICAALAVGEFFVFSKKVTRHGESKNLENRVLTQPKDHYASRDEIAQQLAIWTKEIPYLTEVDSYGTTADNNSCLYFRVGTKDKPKILIQSGLDPNEECAILCNLNLIYRFLSEYHLNPEVKWLVHNRDIYFVPLANPDGFQTKTSKNELLNVFPSPKNLNPKICSSSKLLMEFANAKKFQGSLNLHTFGEHILPPSIANDSDAKQIYNLVDKMCGKNGYLTKQIRNQDGDGNDTDYLYSTGACSITMQVGQDSKSFVSYSETKPTVNRIYSSVLMFMKEAAEIDLNPQPLKTIYFYNN